MKFHTSQRRSGASRLRKSTLALGALVASTTSYAADGTWTRTEADGLWSDSANWQNGTIADGASGSAIFGGTGVAVNLDGNRTLGDIRFGGTGTWAVAGSGALTLNDGATSPVIHTEANATIANVVAGTNGLTKTGAGSLTLSAANTYTGTTRIEAGTLFATTAQLNSTPVVLAGGTLRPNGNTQTLTNAISVSGSGGITFGTGSNWLSGPITSVDSSAVLTLNQGNGGSNTTTFGTALSGFDGTLVLQHRFFRFRAEAGGAYDTASGESALWQVNETATLAYQAGTNDTVSIRLGGLQGTGTLSGGNAAGTGLVEYDIGRRGGDTTFSGKIQDGSTKTALVKTGTGTLTLAGNSTYTGVTRVEDGILEITGSITSAVDVKSGGELKLGGGTTIPLGVTVASGGTLSGSGTVGGVALVGGTLSPGNSIGLLNFGGDLTLLATAVTNLEILGSSFDRITGVGSTVQFGGTLNLLFDPANAPIDGQVQLFEFASYSGAFDEVNITGLPAELGATFNPVTGSVLFASVPEPGASVLVLGAFGLMAMRRRRR